MLEEVVVGWGAAGWIMVDEVKLHSPIHSTFEALVVQHVVGCCHGEELGTFYWPMTTLRGCSLQCTSSICWAYFSDVMVSTGFRKL